MSTIRLQDALGEIEDTYILEAHTAPTQTSARPRKWIAAVLIAALVAVGLIACAPILFSSISGDELSFYSSYLGNGIVEITVENQSCKNLKFQPVLKLERWATGEEIPAQGKTFFSNTTIPAGSSGVMTIDLSSAYDMAELERPISGDWYYLVLTNNRFLFGQDWMCSVNFADAAQNDSPVYPVQPSPAEADPLLVQRVIPELRDLFDHSILADRKKREEIHAAYYERCMEISASSGKHLIHPAFPAPVFQIDALSAGTILDPNIPEATQYQLITQTESTLDSYAFPVGAAPDDCACILGVIVPQTEADLFDVGGADIRLLYLMIYTSAEVQEPDACTIIRGQLVSMPELLTSMVYQDDQYAVFNVTEYFFSSLDTHVDAFRKERTDLYFNADVQTRIRNAYVYLQDAATAIHPCE